MTTTYIGNAYGMVIQEEQVGSDFNLTLSFTDLPFFTLNLKLKYRDVNTDIITTLSGTLSSPQSFTIPAGTYDYEVTIIHKVGLTQSVTETISFVAPSRVFLEVPHLNPINFVDKNRELLTNYNFKHFDAWKDCEQQLPFETKKCYYQKWQNNDIVHLQVKANFSPIRIKVRNETGLVVLSQVMDIVRTIGSTIYFQAQIGFDDTNIFPEGSYSMEIIAGDPVLITLVSEKFYVSENHEDTLLFKYSNNFNDLILWETGIEMNFRVEGVIPFEAPDSIRTVYTDQRNSAATVRGDAYRKYRLYVGTAAGMPNWVIDKVEDIIDQNNLDIDNKPFAPASGATWNTKKIERYPWAEWNIEMREANNRRSKRFETSGLQEKKVVIEYIVEGKLFGPVEGEANDNTYTINDIE